MIVANERNINYNVDKRITIGSKNDKQYITNKGIIPTSEHNTNYNVDQRRGTTEKHNPHYRTGRWNSIESKNF